MVQAHAQIGSADLRWGRLTLLLALVLLLTATRSLQADTELYGVSLYGNVVQIDTSTGAGTLVGNSGHLANAAASDSQNRVIVGGGSGADADVLYQVDPFTGTSQLYLSLTGRPAGYQIRGLAFNPSDNLYALLSDSDPAALDLLATVDTTTGVLSPAWGIMGQLDRSDIQGIGFDGDYLRGVTSSGDYLAIKTSPRFHGTKAFGGSGINFDGQALECDSLGNIYSAKNNLKELDSSGNAKMVGPIGWDIRGLAAVESGMTFSVDFQGPTSGSPDAFAGTTISPGDILTPSGTGVPGIRVPFDDLGISRLASECENDTSYRHVELDALSYGRDTGTKLHFSVDEFAEGASGTDLWYEGAGVGRNQEASADVFSYVGTVDVSSHTTPRTYGSNDFYYDGNGVAPTTTSNDGPGLDLVEPNPPGYGFPDGGDNLDAMDLNTLPSDLRGPIYFSLDGAFVDPMEGRPANTGTAARNLVSGADVLVQPSRGSAFSVYAPAYDLGLLGADAEDWERAHDDLDALALYDDGDMVFEPDEDTILFSVRAGSQIIGQLDSRTNEPIEEGDILTVPDPGGSTPAIVVYAESLGIFSRRMGCTSGSCGDVNALDVYDVLSGSDDQNPGGDLDVDGDIDLSDLLNIQRGGSVEDMMDWWSGFTGGDGQAPAITAVPEPTAWCLLLWSAFLPFHRFGTRSHRLLGRNR